MSFYKPLTVDQVSITKESLYELIPITGTLVSGTYGTYPNDTNVLKYTASHGLFESVYDYPYASSSANQIFDLTFGLRSGSLSPVTQSAQKYRIYQEMAQTLLGFDVTGNVRNFQLGSSTIDRALFVNFSRLLTKDGIKITSFTASMGTGSWATPYTGTLLQLSDNLSTLTQDNANVDSPVGQYWYLYTGSTFTSSDRVGLLFYQQGVAVLNLGATNFSSLAYSSSVANPAGGYLSGSNLVSTGTITEISDGFRRYVNNIQFQNTVQINSTIYNCQIGLNEFNYSSNQTYVSGSSIRTKTSVTDPCVTYVTTVGLYDAQQNLTAVAKLSEPIKKTNSDALNIRVRLDY
jgi:hypothetical protein